MTVSATQTSTEIRIASPSIGQGEKTAQSLPEYLYRGAGSRAGTPSCRADLDRACPHDAYNKAPFNLVPRFAEGQSKLKFATSFNFVTTDDIIRRNSDSPVINGEGDLVGLIFDGNIESLVGDYVYDLKTNRAVAIDTAGMTEALKKLYNVASLLNELLGR